MPSRLGALVLAAAAAAATTAAAAPTAQEKLVFRDVNIAAVTDVHSWIAGGDRQVPAGTPALDASFGDLTSFVERAKAAAAKEGKDVFLIDNGDVIDGTGLSNTAADHCEYLLPLLRRVPFDALNCGNHELYSNATMEAFAADGFVDYWNGTYLTSNLRNATTGRHLGATSTVLVGPVSGVRVLVLGFMYEMAVQEGRCTGVAVDPIANATTDRWFHDALGDGTGFDAVLLLAHMDCFDNLIDDIVGAVRAKLPQVPVQVIAGHSHARKERALDGRAAVFEPGNYFNTLGFASFDLPNDSSPAASAAHAAAAAPANVTFHFTDVNTSVGCLARALGTTPGRLPTPSGAAVGAAIAAEQARLGLTDVLGCSEVDYLEGPALFNLYVDKIVPGGLFTPPGNKSQWFVQSTGSLRYDLYKGNVTADDIYKVLPFKDKLYVVRGVAGADLAVLLQRLNHYDGPSSPATAATARGSRHLDHYHVGAAGGVAWDARRARGGAWHGRAAWAATTLAEVESAANGGDYISTDDTPPPTARLDAFFVQFDVPTIQGYLNNITQRNVTVEQVATGPATDTDMMLNWARTRLPKTCR